SEVLGIPDRARVRHGLSPADEQAPRAPRRQRGCRAAVGRARGACAVARECGAGGLLDRSPVRLDPVRAGAAAGGEEAMRIAVAAELLPRRGGDVLERAAFALLFAAGEPQEGLAAFLEKRRPRF